MIMVGNVTREISSMRQPLWLLNLLLLIGLMFTLVFIFMSKIKLPAKKNLFTQDYKVEVKDTPSEKIDTSVIYKKDLFGTLQEDHPKQIIKKKETLPIPPAIIAPKTPEVQSVKFLEPLPITLTGIIFFDDKYLNRVIITDNREKKDSIYKLEDEIEDAQIIKILKDRAVLLRSNGQQEVIYLKQEVNNIEHSILTNKWDKIVSRKSSNIYSLDINEFTHAIKNLSELIFKLDLKTAVKNKKTIGLAVGEIDSNSLAYAMGLSKGDVILEINNMPLSSQDNRMDAYNIITENVPLEISIKLTSNGEVKTIKYELTNLNKSESLKSKIKESALSSNEIELNHQKYKDTVKDIRLRDKQNMFKYKKITDDRNK
jgi:type II secretory pathway component PulC